MKNKFCQFEVFQKSYLGIMKIHEIPKILDSIFKINTELEIYNSKLSKEHLQFFLHYYKVS